MELCFSCTSVWGIKSGSVANHMYVWRQKCKLVNQSLLVPLSPCRVLISTWNPQWKSLHPLLIRCPSYAPPLHASTKFLLLNQGALIQGLFKCCVLDWRALAKHMTHNPSLPQYQRLFWTRRLLTSIWPPRDPLLPASIKLPLSSHEALIQEVSIYCRLDWLTLPTSHPLNPVRQWLASP